MAGNRTSGGNGVNTMGRYPNYGMPPRNNPGQTRPPQGNKKVNPNQKMIMEQDKKILAARQQRALENLEYRRKLESINKTRGGIDRTIYKLAADVKPKKERDYFYIMRKWISFFMFLFILITIAVFALSYLKLPQIPDQYISLFTKSEVVTEGEAAVITDKYSVFDPVFGFIKNLTGKILNKEISLGESPLYDMMLAKSEIGMTDKIAGIVLEYFPIAIIIYAITALITMIKAFLGIFGSRIFKNFGLCAFIMIICGGIVAFGALAYLTEPTQSMAYGEIVNILINGVLGKGGFTAGYGLLALVAIPVLVLLFSMFARKRVPYSIFDN